MSALWDHLKAQIQVAGSGSIIAPPLEDEESGCSIGILRLQNVNFDECRLLLSNHFDRPCHYDAKVIPQPQITMSTESIPTVTVNIPLDELLSPEEIARLDTFKDDCTQKFWITRLIAQHKHSSAPSPSTTRTERTKQIRMSKQEYEAYWATDAEGRYIGSKPQGEGREILRKRLWAELGLFGKSARTGLGERDRTVFRRSRRAEMGS